MFLTRGFWKWFIYSLGIGDWTFETLMKETAKYSIEAGNPGLPPLLENQTGRFLCHSIPWKTSNTFHLAYYYFSNILNPPYPKIHDAKGINSINTVSVKRLINREKPRSGCPLYTKILTTSIWLGRLSYMKLKRRHEDYDPIQEGGPPLYPFLHPAVMSQLVYSILANLLTLPQGMPMTCLGMPPNRPGTPLKYPLLDLICINPTFVLA